jgi:thioredoxin reductase (NADPH)
MSVETREQIAETPDPYGAYPRLSDEQIAALEECGGTRRQTSVDEVLFREGDRSYDFIVVLQGLVAIVEHDHGVERPIAAHGPGRFLGELNLLTGETAFVSAVVREPGEVLVVPSERLRELVARDPLLGDLVLRAFVVRRSILIGLNAGLRIVGSRHSPDTRRLREFAARNRLPHSWIDLERYAAAETLLENLGITPAETPVVIWCSEKVLRNPTNAELARVVGMPVETSSETVCDLVIVGMGPAGLAAAVYAASEGLATVVLDAVAAGGQAATSSRIENYLGFVNGISGNDLAARAVAQATKFGAHVLVAGGASRLTCERRAVTVGLADGRRLEARVAIIACGAAYRRLPLADIARFEGKGVYYAATYMEQQLCRDDEVIVVGAGNSAGQAAVFLAGSCRRVHLLVRGEGLADSMSRYLVQRIERHARIALRTRTEITALEGNARLERVRWTDRRSGATETRDVRHVFTMTGADPCSGWLRGCVALDANGFVKTGPDLTDEDLAAAQWPLARRPHLLETSRPGVFAVGDIRAGNVKRVASAVGEGSVAVAFVHRVLQE